jgi:hypothetical protein
MEYVDEAKSTRTPCPALKVLPMLQLGEPVTCMGAWLGCNKTDVGVGTLETSPCPTRHRESSHLVGPGGIRAPPPHRSSHKVKRRALLAYCCD